MRSAGRSGRDDQTHRVRFRSLYFPNSATGYAVGSSQDLANGFVLFKTGDGGATWQSSVIPSEPGSAENVFFIDELTGYVRIGYPDTGLLYRTADGGKSWNRVAASRAGSTRLVFPAGIAPMSRARMEWSTAMASFPIGYSAKGMLDAPMMPGFEAGN